MLKCVQYYSAIIIAYYYDDDVLLYFDINSIQLYTDHIYIGKIFVISSKLLLFKYIPTRTLYAISYITNNNNNMHSMLCAEFTSPPVPIENMHI